MPCADSQRVPPLLSIALLAAVSAVLAMASAGVSRAGATLLDDELPALA